MLNSFSRGILGAENMDVLRVKNRNEYVFNFNDFVRLVQEYMGDDAERYLLERPIEMAMDEYQKAIEADELIADGYLEQIREANEAVGQLYQMILDSDFGKYVKYKEELAKLLTKCVELKKILVY